LQKHILCDPQTSGGLLVAVAAEEQQNFEQQAKTLGLSLKPIGQLANKKESSSPYICVN
jgi:selenide,water dikinase